MRSSINVIHTIASISANQGGPSYTVRSLAAAQTELTSGSVHLVAVHTDASMNSAGVASIRLHKITPRWPMSLFETRSVLKQIQVAGNTILHDQGIWHPQNYSAAGFAAAHQLPYVISTHGMLEPWALNYRPLRKKFARWLYQGRLLREANCLMATSTNELASLRKAGLRNPVAVIPNGMDSDIPALERSVSGPTRTALFLSRIHPVKGLIHAIEAWNSLRPSNWRLRIVGPSENHHRAELEALVSRYGLENHVHFEDALAGIKKYQCYHDADVFILPSHSENFGVVVAEALACGLPVITTTGTPWQELKDRACGWYIETGTTPLIAALREAFSTDPQQLRDMGKRGQQWVRSEFQWPKIAAQNLAVYEWVLGRQARPSFIEV